MSIATQAQLVNMVAERDGYALYAQARKRDQNDPEFHARVRAAFELLTELYTARGFMVIPEAISYIGVGLLMADIPMGGFAAGEDA